MPRDAAHTGYKAISADCPPPYTPCCAGYADYCPGDHMSVQVL
jgi:hypothetical protein